MNIYQKLGEQGITAIVTQFYLRAFSDPIIGHFFFRKNHDLLLKGQLAFTIAMLGGPNNYRGRSMHSIHKNLPIKNAHFNRRLTLLREMMEKFQIDADSIHKWLAQEEKLRHKVVTAGPASCQH